jgi:hypothetical protein
MLKNIALGTALVFSATWGQASFAASYVVSLAGTIGNGYSMDKDFKQVPNPISTLKSGDPFKLTYRFDPEKSSVQSLFDADPTINIYYGTASKFTLSIGDYTLSDSVGESNFLSTQLWDNYLNSGSGPTDSFSQSLLQRLMSTSPIDLGAGPVNFVSTLYNFDYSATVRNSDLITEITPLTAYSSKSASFGFINASTYLQTSFSVDGLTASVSEVAAVPEPATWTMMLAGMGIIGFMLRRNKRAVVSTVRIG